MTKTVAVIGCFDTKLDQVNYFADAFSKAGYGVFTVDTSLMPHNCTRHADAKTRDIIEQGGYSWDSFLKATKSERIIAVRKSIGRFMLEYYKRGAFHAAIASGGAQNSYMAMSAMLELPFGVPKIIVSCVAAGANTFEALVGRTDIAIFPAVADIVDFNPILKVPMDNAINAMLGMLNGSGRYVRDKNHPLVGITCAGVTYKGTVTASDLLKAHGIDTVFFHGVTAGGYSMEDFIQRGELDGALDLCIHDVLVEAIGYYRFNHTEDKRLMRLAKSGLPAVISLSGMDVIDIPLEVYQNFKDMPQWGNRNIFYHNATALHLKVIPSEMKKGAELLVERLNEFKGPVTVVMPNNGFRANTMRGGELYDPEVDRILMDAVLNGANKNIKVIEIDCNANDNLFGETVAVEYLKLIG